MKVYELMKELSKMPAGAKVTFHRLAEKSELPKYPDEQRLTELDFEIREVCEAGDNLVQLDGWAE